ncbi:MAG: hypothetical protein ACE5EG_03350, partial [Thermoanaerobaculia bacterium]
MSLGRIAAAIGTVVALVLPPVVGAATSTPPDLKSLFPSRAEIYLDHPGLSRLFLPPEILAECQPDLSDLRIVDRGGREVPYLVDGGPPPDAVFEESIVFEPQLLSASQETIERESAPDLLRESYHLSLPEGEPRGWDLVVESRHGRFVRRFEMTAVQEGREAIPVWEGSLF